MEFSYSPPTAKCVWEITKMGLKLQMNETQKSVITPNRNSRWINFVNEIPKFSDQDHMNFTLSHRNTEDM